MFNEKLKKTMQELEINQTQLVGMTGISKSGISQYLSGKNEPSEEKRKHIAVSLGLSPNYFEEDDSFLEDLKKARIQRLLPKDVARIMGLGYASVCDGLQQGVFPWGYAIHTSSQWTYVINAKRFAEIEGVAL